MIHQGYPDKLAGKLIRDFYNAMETSDLQRVREMLEGGFPLLGDLKVTAQDGAVKVAHMLNMTDVLRVFKRYMLDWGMTEDEANAALSSEGSQLFVFTAAESAKDYAGSALQFLIEECDVHANVESSMGYTPLHMAATAGAQGAIEPLVKRGCDINFVNNRGRTPLGEALYTLQTGVAEELLRLGCNRSVGTARLKIYPAAAQAFMKAYEARERVETIAQKSMGARKSPAKLAAKAP